MPVSYNASRDSPWAFVISTFYVRCSSHHNLSLKMHHDSIFCLLWTMFPVMWDWRRWRGARVKKSREREMMWDSRYRQTETVLLCEISALYPLKNVKGKKWWASQRLCVTPVHVHAERSFLCGEKKKDIFHSLWEKSFMLFIFHCGFSWWNWWVIGLAIMLSILLCWSKLRALLSHKWQEYINTTMP